MPPIVRNLLLHPSSKNISYGELLIMTKISLGFLFSTGSIVMMGIRGRVDGKKFAPITLWKQK